METMADSQLRSASGWTFKIFQKEIKKRKANFTLLKVLCAVLAGVEDATVDLLPREHFLGPHQMISPNALYVSPVHSSVLNIKLPCVSEAHVHW